PGIAALVEADPTQRVEIEHLRDELVLGPWEDDRHAGTDGEPAPAGKAGCAGGAEAFPQRRGRGRLDTGKEAGAGERSQAPAFDRGPTVQGRRSAGELGGALRGGGA